MKALILLGLFAGVLAGCGKPEPKTSAQAEATTEDTEAEKAKVSPALGDVRVTILQTRGREPAKYQLGDRETADIEELGRWLRRLKKLFDEGGVAPAGRVYASHSARTEDIEAVLREFADAGFDKVQFYGSRRKISKSLPFPDSAER